MSNIVVLDIPDEIRKYVFDLTQSRPFSNDAQLFVKISSDIPGEDMTVELTIPNIDCSFISIFDWKIVYDQEIALASKSDDVKYCLRLRQS